MIIGVDAGALSITDERLRVGVWRVTYNLLRELNRIDKANEYRLYTFTPIGRGVMRAFGPRMKNVIVRPTFAWTTIQLPIELRRHPVDVFLGLSQMLPYSTSRNIGFIYDLGFLHYPKAYPGSLNRLTNQTKQLVKRADKIITVSEITQKDIARTYRVSKSKIAVAYPGVDARFTQKATKHKEINPYILFVGALKRGKNVPFALRVFKNFLDATHNAYDFVIAGGNYWEDPEINSTVKDLGLADHVKFADFVSDKMLPHYYRGASALIITSLWEGFCLPAVEAMASGCPVVYARTGSLPEIVGPAGESFTGGNEDDAVKSLLSVVTKPVVKQQYIRDGLARSRDFSWKELAQKVYRTIESG